MKKLYLLRHAKALVYSPNNLDIDRPINEEGKREAELVGELLLKKNEIPQLIISSSALRAISTAKIVAQKTNYTKNKILVDKNIYNAKTITLKKIIQNLDDKIDSVMLVGHNPGISDLVDELSASNFDFLPTAGFVCLEKNIQGWDEIDGDWKLKYSESPSS